MQYANPNAFLFFAVLLGFIIWIYIDLKRKRKAYRSLGNIKLIKEMIKGISPLRRALKTLLFLTAFGLGIMAMARPRYGGKVQLLKKRGIDIAIALDFSKSMLARDIYPSRIEVAKRELTNLISTLKGDRVGLVAFAGDTLTYPLTTDYEAASLFWQDLHPYDMPVGGTAIGRAIVAATRLLTHTKPKKRTKIIILFTDGEDHEGDPLEAAKQAKNKNIKIYVVGIGRESNELIPLYFDDKKTWQGYQKDAEGNYITTKLTKKNEKKLKEIAKITNGKYFRAKKGTIGINKIYHQIQRLKKAELKERKIITYEEIYTWFLVPCLLLLIIEAIFGEKIKDEK
jgi:Ca-activated chloride channel family protein